MENTLLDVDTACICKSPQFNPLSSSAFPLSQASPSRTCRTDRASSCMNFGKTASPGWGSRRFSLRLDLRVQTVQCEMTFPPLILYRPSFLSATCSLPSARPSSAVSLTPWKSQRWCPPCSSQVSTTLELKKIKKPASHLRMCRWVLPIFSCVSWFFLPLVVGFSPTASWWIMNNNWQNRAATVRHHKVKEEAETV